MSSRLALITALAVIFLTGEGMMVNDWEWPMWRRDVQNSGHSPLRGNMNRTPDVLWTYPIGGHASQAQSLDLDGDGLEEVILVSAGRIRAIQASGDAIWATPSLDLTSILDVADLGADGSTEIIVCRSSPSAIFVLDSKSGSVLWNRSFPSPSSGIGRYSIKVADVSSKAPGPELLVWPYKSMIGYAYAFPQGAGSGQLVWTASAEETRNYPPPIAVADLDLDGVQDLVIATYEKIYAFDGETGKEKMVAHSPGINRNYGTLIITNLDQDPYPEIALLAPNLNEHLWIVDNDGSRLTQIWNRHFEYSYPDDLIDIKVTVGSVSDLDGDGLKEIAFSVYNQISDARWHTKIWDALTGSEKFDLPDQYLLGVVDVDGDGTDEVITSEQHQRSPTYYSNVTIHHIQNSSATIVGVLGLVMDHWAPLPASVNTIANPETWMKGGAGFVVWAQNGSLGFLGMLNGSVSTSWVIDQREVGASLNVRGVYAENGIIASGSDGWLRVINASGQLLGKSMTGGHLSSVIAADLDLDGYPEILVRNSAGSQVILGSNGEEIMRFSAAARWAKYGKDGSLVIWDIDGDGSPEILAAGTEALLVLNISGKQIRSYPLPSNPYDWAVANVTGDSHWDFFVCTLGAGGHVASTLAIDGFTGEVLWQKEYGTYAGFMAVFDYDQDGLEDLLMREHFDLIVVMGPTGQERKPSSICGYHTPLLADLEGDGTTEIVWGGGWGSLPVDRKRSFTIQNQTYYYISQIWVRLFGGGDSDEIYGKMPAVADVDGDGIKEVGIGNRNGTFHCFDGSRGTLEWNFQIGSGSSDAISCDIDSDGLDEFILGTLDGRLVCLGIGGLEWSYDFGYPVGDPVICDLDRDKMADILVPVMDGNLYALHISEGLALMTLAGALLVGSGIRSRLARSRFREVPCNT